MYTVPGCEVGYLIRRLVSQYGRGAQDDRYQSRQHSDLMAREPSSLCLWLGCRLKGENACATRIIFSNV
jgi:hypothetical protein